MECGETCSLRNQILTIKMGNDMNIVQRINSPTPSFFKKLRNIGLMLAGISTAIASSPVVLPAAIVSIAGYAAVAGGVIGAVSQLATDRDTHEKGK